MEEEWNRGAGFIQGLTLSGENSNQPLVTVLVYFRYFGL